jgi:hypothetical protein
MVNGFHFAHRKKTSGAIRKGKLWKKFSPSKHSAKTIDIKHIEWSLLYSLMVINMLAA